MTSETIIDAQLGALVKEIGKASFVEDYTPTKEEVLGIIISKFLQWDGGRIAKATYMAFEDANFHTLNKAFAELLRKHGIEVDK